MRNSTIYAVKGHVQFITGHIQKITDIFVKM